MAVDEEEVRLAILEILQAKFGRHDEAVDEAIAEILELWRR